MRSRVARTTRPGFFFPWFMSFAHAFRQLARRRNWLEVFPERNSALDITEAIEPFLRVSVVSAVLLRMHHSKHAKQ